MTYSPGMELVMYVLVSRDPTLNSDTDPISHAVYPDPYLHDFESLQNDGYQSNHVVIPYSALMKKSCIE